MATRPQVSRWKHDRRLSLQQFMASFPDDDACADWLEQRCWPDGFVCPCCHARKGWKLETKPWTFECAGCGKQTSVTAGTILHGTHLPLRTWFIAAHLVATHSNGVSALQLRGKLGIGSYKAAWLLLHKLRKSMVDSDRDPLAGMVEVDETSIALACAAERDGQGPQVIFVVIYQFVEQHLLRLNDHLFEDAAKLPAKVFLFAHGFCET
jgi:hypothetical protein